MSITDPILICCPLCLNVERAQPMVAYTEILPAAHGGLLTLKAEYTATHVCSEDGI